MAQIIGVNVDPVYISMIDIKRLGLIKTETMEVIKSVSGTAFRENAVRVAVDLIEREIQELSFESTPYKKTNTFIVKNCDVVIQTLDELLVRVQGVKGSE